MAVPNDAGSDAQRSCLSCGYDLRGHEGGVGRCPECGQRWTAATLGSAARSARVTPTLSALVSGTVGCTFFLAAFWGNNRAWLCVLLLVSISALCYVRYARLARKPWRRMRALFYLQLAAGLPTAAITSLVRFLLHACPEICRKLLGSDFVLYHESTVRTVISPLAAALVGVSLGVLALRLVLVLCHHFFDMAIGKSADAEGPVEEVE